MRFIDSRIPRYLAAGIVNTGVTYVVYVLLLRVSPYRVAFTIAFVLGILLSYALNARFVFARRAQWRSFLRFPFVYLGQYLAGLALVSMLVEWGGVDMRVAPLVALVVTIPLTYLLTRAVFIGKGAP
jgi:putative flippase GtrA